VSPLITNVLDNSSNNTITNNVTNNVTNHHNQLRALGEEDVAFLLSDDNFVSFVRGCIHDGLNGVCNFMVNKHFDPDHPENHNVRKFNRRSPFMEFFDGQDWSLGYDDYVLGKVFDGIEDQFKNYVKEIGGAGAPYPQRSAINRFMLDVGVALGWELQAVYTNVPQDRRDKIRNKIFALASELVARECPKLVRRCTVQGPWRGVPNAEAPVGHRAVALVPRGVGGCGASSRPVWRTSTLREDDCFRSPAIPCVQTQQEGVATDATDRFRGGARCVAQGSKGETTGPREGARELLYSAHLVKTSPVTPRMANLILLLGSSVAAVGGGLQLFRPSPTEP
jgi:hypothetical protein